VRRPVTFHPCLAFNAPLDLHPGSSPWSRSADALQPLMTRDFLFFYSWQSDSPNRTNRGFVKDALVKASRAVTAKALVEEPVRVTSDVQGAPGAPDISGTILAAIDASDGFVADVSTAVRGENNARTTPNPNVLIELGYAAHALGWERVIMS
jgi:hypothetical protein